MAKEKTGGKVTRAKEWPPPPKLNEKGEKPYNHVLEVQNSTIDVRDLFKRIDRKIKEKAEEKNG